MKTILLSIVATLVLGAAAAGVLSITQEPAYQAYSTTSTRVTRTDNLVGPNWTGTPNPRPPATPH